MKKIYSLLFPLLLLLISSQSSFGQTFTSVSHYDSCSRLSLQAAISAAGTNLKSVTYWGDGTSDTMTLQTSQTSMWFWHQYQMLGSYTVLIKLFKNGVAIDSNRRTFLNNCSYIYLQSYLDNNSNCTRDTGEGFFPMSFEVDSAGTVIDTITSTGVVRYKANKSGVVYKFRGLSMPFGVSASCPSSGIVTVTSPTTSTGITAYYGAQCGSTTQFDLYASFVSQFRPVNISRMYIHVGNRSCGSKNGVVTLQLSNKYKYKRASVTPASVVGNVITWNVSNLSLHNKKTISVEFDTATTVTLNDTICNTVIITPITGDAVTTNNVVNQCDEVRASWDPNDKHVMPAGNIQPGTKLTYTVNFENLGNDTAFNIHILDTLSQFLIPSSFELISSSHPVSYTFDKTSANDNLLRFDFENIYLPDSNSKQYNKGYVTFSMNTKQGIAPLVKIRNRAGIYFDINPVVLTNYAENQIEPLSVQQVNAEQVVAIYPNPVSHILTIKTDNKKYTSIRVYNSLGQTMLAQKVTGELTNINMESLSTGVYTIQLIGAHDTKAYKVEKL